MNFSRYNLVVIFLSFILTLGILLGGRWIYHEFGVMGPLKKNLSQEPTVRQTMIKTGENKLIIELELGEVQSLHDSVSKIEKLLPNNDAYTLIIKDKRNEYLKGLLSQNRFALEEAAYLGNLTEMQELIKNNLGKAELDRWLLEVDEESLYLQMHMDEAYLYEIVPRHIYPPRTGENNEWAQR